MSIHVYNSPCGRKVKFLSKIDLPCDVKFIFNKVFKKHQMGLDLKGSAERQEIEAHRFVLALGSEIFRAQFYGGLQDKPGEEIEIKDWSFYDFKIFIKCLYTDVNLENYNIMTLCELYYIADFYNVSEMKTAVIETLSAPDEKIMYEELLAIDLAMIAHRTSGIHPDLSDALFMKARQILRYYCKTQTENIENFFNMHRDLFDDPNDPIYDDVIQTFVARFGPCQNCLRNTSAGNCIYPPYLDMTNFRPGALVINQPSEHNTSQLNQRVYRLGQFDRESGTFTAFDRFGVLLPVVELRMPYRDFLFNCSAGNADPSVIYSND